MKKNNFLLFVFFALHFFTNAQSWTELGPGAAALPAGYLNAVVTDPAGNVYTAGTFKNSNDEYYVAKWDGSSWSELGTGTNPLKANGEISALVSDKSGNIYAAGFFTNGATNNNGFNYVAKWDGSNWTELGTASDMMYYPGAILSLTIDKDDNIYAAGNFSDITGKSIVLKWDGSSWSGLGSGTTALRANSAITSIAVDGSGNVYAGGFFTNGSDNSLGNYYVAHWDGSSWSELGGTNTININFFIYALACDASGNVYAGGGFTNASNYFYVTHWNGSSWSELGTGNEALNANLNITALTVDAAGALYAGGEFSDANSTYYVAKWNGTTWTELGTGANSLFAYETIKSIAVDLSGNVYAAIGKQFIKKFDPTPITTANVNPANTIDVAVYPNPSDGNIELSNLKEDVELQVQDMIGKTVYTRTLKKEQVSINLKGLASGMYTLLLSGQQGIYTPVKLVVE